LPFLPFQPILPFLPHTFMPFPVSAEY